MQNPNNNNFNGVYGSDRDTLEHIGNSNNGTTDNSGNGVAVANNGNANPSSAGEGTDSNNIGGNNNHGSSNDVGNINSNSGADNNVENNNINVRFYGEGIEVEIIRLRQTNAQEPQDDPDVSTEHASVLDLNNNVVVNNVLDNVVEENDNVDEGNNSVDEENDNVDEGNNSVDEGNNIDEGNNNVNDMNYRLEILNNTVAELNNIVCNLSSNSLVMNPDLNSNDDSDFNTNDDDRNLVTESDYHGDVSASGEEVEDNSEEFLLLGINGL